jgi:translation initiation factor 1
MQGRVVYSTGAGRVCSSCGWPAAQCRCSSKAEERVPDKPVAKLRLEKKGRAGKAVTVVDGLPRNAAFVDALAAELKRACGTGGTAKGGIVELQGDHREKAATLLATKGFTVKGGVL